MEHGHPRTSKSMISLEKGAHFRKAPWPPQSDQKVTQKPPKVSQNWAKKTLHGPSETLKKKQREKDTKNKTKNKPVLAREREARFKEEHFLSAASYTQDQHKSLKIIPKAILESTKEQTN